LKLVIPAITHPLATADDSRGWGSRPLGKILRRGVDDPDRVLQDRPCHSQIAARQRGDEAPDVREDALSSRCDI